MIWRSLVDELAEMYYNLVSNAVNDRIIARWLVMPNPFRSRRFKDLLPFFLLAIAIIAAYMIISEIGQLLNVIGRIWSIITPFFYGFILAYIINIPYSLILMLIGKIKLKFISKRKKMISLIITFLLLAAILFSLLYLVIPYIYDTVSVFIANMPAYYESAMEFVDYVNSLDLFGLHISMEGILAGLQELFQNISIENLFSSLNALLAVPSAIFAGFLAFISSIYILVEKDKFRRLIRKFLRVFAPDKVSELIFEYTGRLNRNFKQYIRIQTIDGVILGSIATALLVILGSPYAVVLGIMLGIVNYIPYFGSIVGTIFTVIVIAFTQGLTRAAIAAALLLVVQQIDGNVIQPKLMSQSFKFSPLLVIISVTVGGAFAGVLGMIAAIPIAAMLKDLCVSLVSHYERKKFGEIAEDDDLAEDDGADEEKETKRAKKERKAGKAGKRCVFRKRGKGD